MICKYEYRDNILFQTLPEVLTISDALLLVKEMDSIDNGYSVMPNRLVNFQGTKSFQGDFGTVLGVAEQRERKKFPNHFKSALLVANTFQLGFARMFQTLDDNPQITMKIFMDESKAIEWLKTDDTHVSNSSS